MTQAPGKRRPENLGIHGLSLRVPFGAQAEPLPRRTTTREFWLASKKLEPPRCAGQRDSLPPHQKGTRTILREGELCACRWCKSSILGAAAFRIAFLDLCNRAHDICLYKQGGRVYDSEFGITCHW